MKTYQCINEKMDAFFPKTLMDTSIEKTLVKISANDIMMIQNTLNYLLEQMPKG